MSEPTTFEPREPSRGQFFPAARRVADGDRRGPVDPLLAAVGLEGRDRGRCPGPRAAGAAPAVPPGGPGSPVRPVCPGADGGAPDRRRGLNRRGPLTRQGLAGRADGTPL